MTPETRLLMTKVVIVASFCMSGVSYVNRKCGGASEIYPFFHWHLFGLPTGANATRYCIDTLDEGGGSTRQAVRPIDGYTRKEYRLEFDILVMKFLEHEHERDALQRKLAVFVQHATGHEGGFRIVKESYQPLELLETRESHDEIIVEVAK